MWSAFRSPHVAIGTSAIAVAASAAANLSGHTRAGTVKWRCALVFALAGIVGAAGGAQLGKMVDGGRLLMLFGVLMVAVGLMMLRPRKSGGNPDVMLTRESMPRLLPLLLGVGFSVGALSGFFGIGGGFLIVPGLMGATAMPLINAIGSSLVSVTAFGLPPRRAMPGPDWSTGLWPFCSLSAARSAALSASSSPTISPAATSTRSTLTFSGIVIAVGLYVIARSIWA